ncbi:Endonuclease/exonuclease/phosphatase [Scheffersomyces amazonensis]|uniref:Endonuclease/exonuclease/phosphatase n=1 Tax=Scheffersomyces amazonensis TaxID=1078765 RepID=UPI00315DCB10
MTNLPVYLFTYNCNRQKINSEIFIPKFEESLPAELATLYVFGLQELCSILDGSFPQIANQHLIGYNEVFLKALSSKYGKSDIKFQTISLYHTGSIGLILITPYPSKFKHVLCASSSCGYGYSSLKGAVGTRLTYANDWKPGSATVDISVACAHLSANEGEAYYQQRNEEVYGLMRSLDFGDGYGLIKPGSHTFFLGDLNYRTSKSYVASSPSAQRLLSSQDQSIILRESFTELIDTFDELTIAKRNGDVFTGFSEGSIEFPPTYKYHINTAIYNSKRSPSWCDRILYQSTYHTNSELVPRLRSDEQSPHIKLPVVKHYSSISSILLSDHQPVYAFIVVPFQAPKSIINSSGYLKVLPNSDQRSDTHIVSGPTQVYILPTKFDYIIQNYIRHLSDFLVGSSLWLSFTKNGRILLLVIIGILWYLVYVW